MSINMIPKAEMVVKIKVAGIGGAGINIISHLDRSTENTVQRIAIDTNAECVNESPAEVKIQLGAAVTKGLGTGGQPDLGNAVAADQQVQIRKALENTDMLFIAAGMGGGTGSGAAPVVASIAKELGILTVAVVTRPFFFEGRARMTAADRAIEQLTCCADAIVVVPNENLKYASDEKLTFRNAFNIADEVLGKTVSGIVDVIRKPAYINSDFADVCTILQGSGRMHLALAAASNAGQIDNMIQNLLSSRILATSADGAKGVLLCISASMDTEMDAIEHISTTVQQAADPDANIIFGLDFTEDTTGEIRVMLLAADIR